MPAALRCGARRYTPWRVAGAGVALGCLVVWVGVRDYLADPADTTATATTPASRHLLSAWDPLHTQPGHTGPLGTPGIALWIPLVLWLFLGVAIVADEFFTPALERISDTLELSADVAGATFLAAASSAPEFFTSFADTFLVSDEGGEGFGLGTIVGSAVFNILIICAVSCMPAAGEALRRTPDGEMLSKSDFTAKHSPSAWDAAASTQKGGGAAAALHLDWFPLARDSIFYALSIALLIATVATHQPDEVRRIPFKTQGCVLWSESLAYILLYCGYIVCMKFSPGLRVWAHGWVGGGGARGGAPEGGEAPREMQAFGQHAAAPGGAAAPASAATPAVVTGCLAGVAARLGLRGNAVAPQAAAPPTPPQPTALEGAEAEGEATPAAPGKVLGGCSATLAATAAAAAGGPAAPLKLAGVVFSIDAEQQGGGGGGGGAAAPQHLSGSSSAFCAQRSGGGGGGSGSGGVNNGSWSSSAPRAAGGGNSFNSSSSGGGPAPAAPPPPGAPPSGTAGVATPAGGAGDPCTATPAGCCGDNNSESGGAAGGEGLGAGAEQSGGVVCVVAASAQRTTVNGSDCSPGCGGEEEDDEGGCCDDTSPFWESAFDVPEGWLGRAVWVFSLPFSLAFRVTIPQVTRANVKDLYVLSFAMCILWIAFLSAMMVKVVSWIGAILRIDSVVMGLVVLAAGTSVPDALGSYNEAKRGEANAAVSNALGSNVFDICFGLGVPWFAYSLAYGRCFTVPKDNILIPAIILFLVLGVFLGILAATGMKLHSSVGKAFVALYLLFVAWNLLNEFVFHVSL